MKLAAVKSRLLIAGAVLVGVFVGLSPLASADTYPYLQGHGGDIWTGGSFNNGSACDVSNYQSGNGSGGAAGAGGIATYVAAAGSNDFGAYVLGKVDPTSGSPNHGFKSDSTGAGGSNLTFSNNAATKGLFNDSSACVPDYYGTKQTNIAGAWPVDNYSVTGQYTVNGPVTLGGGQVSLGNKLTVFVNGDVFINGNICYINCATTAVAPGYNETNVPKFALVVKGNIYIQPGVSRLDGWYIAQPNPGTKTNGVIWTCHDNTTNAAPLGPWFLGNCNSALTVNGALTAWQVNYTRIKGDTSTASGAAETINYTPAMVVGGPFFNQSSSGNAQIDSLVSLPPLF